MDENQQRNRVQLAEDFVLNPEKVLFELVTEFQNTIAGLQAQFEGVDPAALEAMKGVDGYNPQRGVDYMTDADLDALEQFILERLPVLGVDIATGEQTEAMVKKYVGKIPSIKGDKGERGSKGDKGKDGSPDTPAEVLAKVKGKLRISDVKELPKHVKRISRVQNELEDLREEFREKYHTIAMPFAQSGSPDTVLTDEQVQDIIGAVIVPEVGSNITTNYNDAGNQIVVGYTDPNCFTATQAGHGFAVGDILHRTPAGDVLSDAVDSVSAPTHKIVKEVVDANTYIWSSNAQYITTNVPAYPDGTELFLAVGGGLTDVAPSNPGEVVNNVGYVEQSGTLMVLHASTPGFIIPDTITKLFNDGGNFLLNDGTDYQFNN